MNVTYEFDYIWNPPLDYIMPSEVNYLKKLKKKIKAVKNYIYFAENQLKDPEINPVYKSCFIIPKLKRVKITLKAFEKPSSILAS